MRKVFLKASNSQNLPSSTSTLTVGKDICEAWELVGQGACQLTLNFTKVHPLRHPGGKTTDSDLWDPNKRRRCTFPPLSATYCHPSQNVKKIKKYQSPSPQIFTQTRKAPNQILIQNHLTQGPMGRRIRFTNHYQRTVRESIGNFSTYMNFLTGYCQGGGELELNSVTHT